MPNIFNSNQDYVKMPDPQLLGQIVRGLVWVEQSSTQNKPFLDLLCIHIYVHEYIHILNTTCITLLV